MTLRLDLERADACLNALRHLRDLCLESHADFLALRSFASDGVFGGWRDATGGFRATKTDEALSVFCKLQLGGVEEAIAALERVERELQGLRTRAVRSDSYPSRKN